MKMKQKQGANVWSFLETFLNESKSYLICDFGFMNPAQSCSPPQKPIPWG